MNRPISGRQDYAKLAILGLALLIAVFLPAAVRWVGAREGRAIAMRVPPTKHPETQSPRTQQDDRTLPITSRLRSLLRQGLLVASTIFVVSYAIMLIANISPLEDDKQCPWQFPKILSCVLGTDLAGGVVGAGGALFAAWLAAWFAWHAIRDQIESDKELARDNLRPLAYIGVGDYEGRVFVKVVNNGTGPMIIKSITVNGETKPLYDALPNPEHWGVHWRHFVADTADRSVPAGGELVLVHLFWASKEKVSEAFAQAREAIRAALGAITVRVEYTDIYNRNQPPAERELKWFHRGTESKA
jgi:hypothetical protein